MTLLSFRRDLPLGVTARPQTKEGIGLPIWSPPQLAPIPTQLFSLEVRLHISLSSSSPNSSPNLGECPSLQHPEFDHLPVSPLLPSSEPHPWAGPFKQHLLRRWLDSCNAVSLHLSVNLSLLRKAQLHSLTHTVAWSWTVLLPRIPGKPRRKLAPWGCLESKGVLQVGAQEAGERMQGKPGRQGGLLWAVELSLTHRGKAPGNCLPG